MKYVRVFYKDGTEDIKLVLSLDEICLDNVLYITIIKEEKAS